MAKHLIGVYSSLSLDLAEKLIDKAIDLRIKHNLLPLAIAALDARPFSGFPAGGWLRYFAIGYCNW